MRAPEFPPGAAWIGSPPLRLAELRAKVVLLDFWTSGCINCMHILPNLHRLQLAFPDRLRVIGVHTPKFSAEKDPARLALVAARLAITHPVVSDPDYAIWQSFAVDAWPTLVFIDPAGQVVARHAGEFDYDLVQDFIEQQLNSPRANAVTLSPVILDAPPDILSAPSVILSVSEESLLVGLQGHEVPPSSQPPLDQLRGDAKEISRLPGPEIAPTALRFPGKLTIDPARQRLFIADSGHQRIVIASLAGHIIDLAGDGKPGAVDGPFETARFDNPQGMARSPGGQTLVVADAGNHLLRCLDLEKRTIRTIAGTGERGFPVAGGPARENAIASPWDVIWFEGRYLIAMAGIHQIWAYDPVSERLEPVAGTGVESIHDDRLPDATFAQPMALTALGRTVYVADSESSAVRALDFESGRVRRILGRGLFHFGDLDAIGDSVRLQHPQGIVATVESGNPVLYLADTFNNKVKRVDPVRREAITIAGTGEQGDAGGDAFDAEFREPSGLALHDRVLYIADTHNHAIRRLDLDRSEVDTLPFAEE